MLIDRYQGAGLGFRIPKAKPFSAKRERRFRR
jgi:hypothetical protein